MIMKFQTNASCEHCAAAIRKAIAPMVAADQVRFDLLSAERTMTVNADADPDAIIRAVNQAGYEARLLDSAAAQQ